MNPLRSTHSTRRLLAGVATVAALAAVPASSLASSGANNRGDFWVDTVGEPAGPGHEMDPHLACADINLWGDKMADPGDSYRIDGWSPSGDKQQAYSSNWSYTGGQGGDQVMDVIDVQTLIANAIANGDAPINKQGFHFKIALSQNPQKFKTFWVKCSLPQPPGDGGSPTPTPQTPPPAATPSTPQQTVLGTRETGGKKVVHRKHRKRVHHRKHKHHKVVAKKTLPAFAG